MFRTVTPEEAGIASSEVLRFIEYLNGNSISVHSLLLIRDDKIFTEAYWKPFHKDFCHRQYSQTKSFVSIAIGLLLEEGKLSLDDKIVDLFPEKIDDKDALPQRLRSQILRQMLTMTTVGDERVWFFEEDPDRVHIYMNGRTRPRLPGALWKYDSAGSQVLSSLVEKISGMSLLSYLNEKLFSRMGSFKTASMLKTPGGDSWGDSAMICTARDMASFAKLLMDGGRYGNAQLINEDYIKEATSALVDNSEEKFGGVFGHGYGYQIWRAPKNGYAFVGMGGQITLTLPDKRLIFVINADTQGRTSAYDLIVNGFYSFIADRIENDPLPADLGSYEKLQKTISSLELFALKGAPHSPLISVIQDRWFTCEANRLGMTRFSFHFDKDCGEFHYTNESGDKIIPFGINQNAFGKFPELGYSDEVGREVTTNGHTYCDAVSLRFTEASKLQMLVQIIDKYFGNFVATFAFSGDEVACKFTATAENFLTEYNGEFTARG